MAKREHLARIKQGVKAWNKWRTANPEIVPDLSRAKLFGVKLNFSNLRMASFGGADLREADLTAAALSGANLKRAQLNGANLRWATLCEANLRVTDLRRVPHSSRSLR